MTSVRSRTVSQIFEAALSLSTEDRARYIREACASDADLESEVLRLLAADALAGSFLERPHIEAVASESGEASSPILTNGALIGQRFQIVRFIGQGGMGQVFEALDLELRCHIALKVIRKELASDPRMLARFRREVQLTRLITHPNVCRTFDIERYSLPAADEAHGIQELVFLTMELLQGETLSAALRREGQLGSDEALSFALELSDALAAAHDVGVVHRDFKPSNILLVQSPSSRPSGVVGGSSGTLAFAKRRAVVTDFGLSRLSKRDLQRVEGLGRDSQLQSLSSDQALMGTLIYMAPEQLERGEVSTASDVYSLGLVLFEMVTGKRPFAEQIPFAEAIKRLRQPAPSVRSIAPDLHPAWDSIISRCLAMEPKERFPHAHQVSQSLIAAGKLTNELNAPHPRQDHRPSDLATLRPKAGTHTRDRIGDLATFLRQKFRVVVAASIVLLSLSGLAFRYYRVRAQEAQIAGGSTVLLMSVQNATGDNRFDGTTNLVRHQLLQSGYFNLLESERIQKTLTQMLKPSDSALDPRTAREVAMRNGVRRVIFGTVSRVGDSYVLDIEIEQPDYSPLRFRRHWDNHWTWTLPKNSRESDIPSDFLNAVRESCDWIRREIGESAYDIGQQSAPPEDITTANWDALSEFAQAERFRAAGNNEGAIVALRSAVSADQTFALAYARLGDILVSLSNYPGLWLAVTTASQNRHGYRPLKLVAPEEFPTPEHVLLDLRDEQRKDKIRQHAWELFSGLTKEAGGVPVWQTWYTKCDVHLAVFDCPETPASSQSGLNRFFRSLEIPTQMMLQLQEQMDTAAKIHIADPAREDKSESLLLGFIRGVRDSPQLASVLFNEDAKRHILDHNLYSAETLEGISETREAAHAFEFEKEIPPFPRQAVVLKTSWEVVSVRKGGLTTPLHIWSRDIELARERTQNDSMSSTDWHKTIQIDTTSGKKCHDGEVYRGIAPLDCFFAYKIRGPAVIPGLARIVGDGAGLPGSYYLVLKAMHVITKETPDWVWATFWWSNDPSDGEYGTDRPSRHILKGNQWRHFLMNTTLSSQTPLEGPSHISGPKICFNPYLEEVFPNGLVSNCLQCHRRAIYTSDQGKLAEGIRLGSTWRDGTPSNDQAPDEHYFDDSIRTDFMWSIAFARSTSLKTLYRNISLQLVTPMD